MRLRRWLAVFLTAAASAASVAAVDYGAERARIRVERSEAQRRHDAQQRECRTRFVVVRCLDAARAERSETLDRLRREELLIDDEQRKQRAAARFERIRAKQAAVESAAAASVPLVVRERPPAASRPTATLRPLPAPRAKTEPDPAREASMRAEFEARQRAAAARRAEVEKRNAERTARSKPAAPVPTPTPESSAQ
jgi:hypothetical protein